MSSVIPLAVTQPKCLVNGQSLFTVTDLDFLYFFTMWSAVRDLIKGKCLSCITGRRMQQQQHLGEDVFRIHYDDDVVLAWCITQIRLRSLRRTLGPVVFCRGTCKETHPPLAPSAPRKWNSIPGLTSPPHNVWLFHCLNKLPINTRNQRQALVCFSITWSFFERKWNKTFHWKLSQLMKQSDL